MKIGIALFILTIVAACGPIPLPPPIWVDKPSTTAAMPESEKPAVAAKHTLVRTGPAQEAASQPMPQERATSIATVASSPIGQPIAENNQSENDSGSRNNIGNARYVHDEKKTGGQQQIVVENKRPQTDGPIIAPQPQLSPSQSQYQIAHSLYDRGLYFQAATILEKQPDHAPSQTLLLSSYEKLIDVLLGNGQLDEAKTLLSKATMVNPMSNTLSSLRGRLEREQQLQREQDKKTATLKAPPTTAAQGSVTAKQKKPVQISQSEKPEQQESSVDATTLQRIQQLHDVAELALGRHEFEQAIRSWNQVLELQSSNQMAIDGIDRVKRLQEKLSKLK